MTGIKYQDLTFTLQEHESVLEVLEKQGQVVPNSCRSGICQSCIMQAVSGIPPSVSQ